MQFLAYVAVLLITAAGLALGLDVMTKPSPPAQQSAVAGQKTAAAPERTAVRQIPIVNAADAGDPNGALSPVYPTRPGKDLPIKDAAVAQQPVAETTGRAVSSNSDANTAMPLPSAAPSQAAPATLLPSFQVPAQTAARDSCNIAACAAAYRSFRESDCSYQPLSGGRALCENPPGATAQQARPPQQIVQPDPRARPAQSADSRYQDELRKAAEAVARLPSPRVTYDDGGPVVVRSQLVPRYGLRRNWIVEGE